MVLAKSLFRHVIDMGAFGLNVNWSATDSNKPSSTPWLQLYGCGKWGQTALHLAKRRGP
jgi:hypothetical protein